MASGKTHDRTNSWVSLFLAGATLPFCWEDPTLLGAAIALALGNELGGRYLSPDLDLEKSNPTNRWRRIKLAWLWGAYRKFPHRSRYTHAPVAGSFIRLLYLSVPLGAIALLLGIEAQVLTLLMENQDVAIGFFLGVEISSLVHLQLDGLLLRLR